MQTVSENWKQMQKRALLNESFVEVSLDIADPESVEDATSEDNGAIYISNSSLLTDGLEDSPSPYCTLEQNLWCLDGGRKAIPESGYGDNCFVGDVLSDNTCVFSGKLPIITINFSKVFTALIPGITITWSKTYGEFADTFEVIAYNGKAIVASKEVTNNRSVKSIVFIDIENYNRIEIIVKKWCLPNHRARVEEIFVGLKKLYGKADLFDYSHTQLADPTSLSLPKNEIAFSIDNISGEYNPHNKDGLAKYLMDRQEVKTRYGLKMDDGSIEWIKGGTFYLSEWYAKQNGIVADFTARDILEFMSKTYFDTEFLEQAYNISENGRTLAHLAESVLTSANVPGHSEKSPKWKIHPSLESIKTTAPLPEDTHANCLQLIANAGRCVLYQDRDGVLCIEPLSVDGDATTDTDYEINAFNSYSRSEITLSKPLYGVGVKIYVYSMDTQPRSSETYYYTPLANPGEIITIDNPLITYMTKPQEIAQWLYAHLSHRMTLDFTWRADVSLDVLDKVFNENNYDTKKVRMTELKYSYNGAFRGTGKGKVISDG